MQRDLKGKLLFSDAISRNIIPGQHTHTHTKPGNNNSFRIPRAKTFHQNLKREVKEMQHAKQET
jgi:hypothetical protein